MNQFKINDDEIKNFDHLIIIIYWGRCLRKRVTFR